MNIQSVKEEIKNTVKIYLTKNRFGDYEVPFARQRPLLVIGAPGIGKTAIVKQVADEMHLGFVSYTITHHTRQSAIGLPFVKEKTYGDKVYSVTEYTLSEIVDSVFSAIEQQNKREGILFIDEINCVSETLAPAMLELLQNKKFGPHKIPAGWVLVAAGNPPEYNKSVKEFDIVTLDRVKKVEAEADPEVWKKYAYDHGVHAAILYYLGLKPKSLFSVQKTVDGVSFVTPRGWEDLSVAITMYEKLGLPVTEELVEEYVQSYEIATEFFRCYLLTDKYNKEYDVAEILAGKTDGANVKKLKEAPFDEKLAVTEVLSSGVNRLCGAAGTAVAFERAMKPVFSSINMMEKDEAAEYVKRQMSEISDDLLRDKEQRDYEAKRETFEALKRIAGGEDVYAAAEAEYMDAETRRKDKITEARKGVENAIAFIELAFGKGQEMVALLVGLVSSPLFIAFLSRNECPVFMEYNRLLLTDRQNKQLLLEIEKLNLDE